MQYKLRRPRRSVFHKKKAHPALKTFGSILLCVAMVAAGFFTAKAVMERDRHKPATDAVAQDEKPSANKPTTQPNTTPEDITPPADTPPTADTPLSPDRIRAFYLPHSALLQEDLSSPLTAARKAGFNAVVFDLKDADGNLYYRFASSQAQKVGSYTSDAFTADGLTALFNTIRTCGLQPIPRLYAFCDDAAAKALTDARISHEENHSWAWYDGDPNNGGKKWLNPYSDAAHAYLKALATEVKDAGAAAVMLEGVQFPLQLSSAYLGETAATVSKSDTLTAFIADTRSALGDACPMLLGCTSASALATDTKVYGGNPLTFGSTVACPTITTKVQDAVEQMILRVQGPDIGDTALSPLLPIADLTAKQVSETLAACVSGGTNSFILYHPDGTYDFAAYTLP